MDFANCDEAREELARLAGLKAAQDAERLRLQRELVDLDQRRGAAALACIEPGAGAKQQQALAAVTADIAKQRQRIEDVDAMVAALRDLEGAAKVAQRAAVANELSRQVVALTEEVQDREAHLGELCKAIMDFEETPGCIMLNPEVGKTRTLKARVGRMRNAVDMVRSGHRSFPDPTTGQPFDAGLW